MNTQTHILLACAVFCAPAVATVTRQLHRRTVVLSVAALVGALFPDASLFAMWGIAKLQGVAESVIWRDWYYSDFWQFLGALTNSFPLFFLLAVAAWLAGGRWNSISLNSAWTPTLLLTFASAAILHVLTDLPLHHDDGHPHFWPFSAWIFRSPVSYWDPAHYGQTWSMIELLIAVGLLVLLWRRFKHKLVRGLLLLVAISYAAMGLYWGMAFS